MTKAWIISKRIEERSSLLVAVALCPAAQGTNPVIALSGDDTRHGIEVLYGRFGGPQIEVSRYHVDTLIQTRFARTVIEVDVRNNGPAKTATIPFAIPENAMLVNFEIDDSNGRVHQSRPMMRDDIVIGTKVTAAKIQARNAESFDIDLELTEYGSVVLRVVYEELLTREREMYENVQQVWPGVVVPDLKLSVRIKESSPINNVTYTFTTETATGVLAVPVDQLVTVVSNPNGAEVSLSLQPSVKEQRAFAGQLGLEAEVGFAGQLRVQYDVGRYPTAGDIVVRDGYFAHFFAPSGLKSIPKYALFLLDVSGSMQGRKIEQLRDAMVTILGQLGPDDFFTVIEFSDYNVMWDLGVVPNAPSVAPSSAGCLAYPADYIAVAQQRAQSMKANGGTAMLDGLKQSISCAAAHPAGLEPILVMLTDGIPNEGIDVIQQATASANQLAGGAGGDLVTSIFTLALGADANAAFLRELALRNGGHFQQIYEAADASVELQKFYESISSPLLTDVEVTFDYQQAVETTVTQRDFRTYFWGSELVVAGRIRPGQGDVITGNVTAIGYGGQSVTYNIQVTAQPSWQPESLGGQPNSERLWAFLYTKQHLDQEVLDGPLSEAANASIDMALLYSFVTPHTCLAVDIINPYQAPTAAPQQPTPRPNPGPTGAPGPVGPTAIPTRAPGPVGPTAIPTSAPGPVSTVIPTRAPGPVGPTDIPTAAPGPVGPTARPGPPGPPSPTARPGPPGPPGPTGAPNPGNSGAKNVINIGSISIGSMTVNGPLIQFSLR